MLTSGLKNLGGAGYAESLSRNDAHFGEMAKLTYVEFHQAALKAASEGRREDALLLEGMAQHTLTDLSAPGHHFDKDSVMDAVPMDDQACTGRVGAAGAAGEALAGAERGTENAAASYLHDDLNQRGTTMRNPYASWSGKGDGYLHEAEENQQWSALAVYASYQELAAVLNDPEAAEELLLQDPKALELIPELDVLTRHDAPAFAARMHGKQNEYFAGKKLGAPFLCPEGSEARHNRGHGVRNFDDRRTYENDYPWTGGDGPLNESPLAATWADHNENLEEDEQNLREAEARRRDMATMAVGF
jgi:hypothetical protein